MPIKKIDSTGGGEFFTVVENPDETGGMGYASMSPDGNKIAYLYYADANVELHIVDIDGANDHVILSADPDAGNPWAWQNVAWGTRYIAINVDGDDGLEGSTFLGEVYIRFVDENGDPPTDAVHYVEIPNWSNGQNQDSARITTLDQSNEYKTPGGDYEQMTWTPSGRYLYCDTFRIRDSSSNEGGKCIVRLDIQDFIGHNLAIIADGLVPNPTNGYTDYTWPALDPTGTMLCVTVRSNPYSGGDYSYKLVLMDYDGSNETLLVNNAAWAVWNSAGTKISAYCAQEGAFGGLSFYTPIVIDVATSAVTAVNSDTASYGNVGFIGDNTGYAENPFTMPHPNPLHKVWFFSSSDNLVHTINPDGTGNVLQDPRSSPNHVWTGIASVDPTGKYVYFTDPSHATVRKVFRSWNNCTHYRWIWDSPAFITLPVDAINVSWDSTKILISISSGQAYAWCDANGADLGAPFNPGVSVANGNPYTVIVGSGWTLFYAQSAMQCLSPDGTRAIVWNSGTDHVGFIDLATTVVTDLGALPWVAPSWSANDQISYIEATNIKIVNASAPSTVLKSFALGGNLETASLYGNMWDPTGAEIIANDHDGNLYRYSVSSSPALLNTLPAIVGTVPFGWS